MNDQTTVQESERRRAAIKTARASVRLEGFILSDESESLFASYIAGSLTRSQLNAEVLKLAKNSRKS